MNDSHRRLRYVYVSKHIIMNLLFDVSEHGYVQKLTSHNLPQGTKFLWIREDCERMGFAVLCEHPEFDEVPDGAPIPHHDIPCNWTVNTFQVVSLLLSNGYSIQTPSGGLLQPAGTIIVDSEPMYKDNGAK